MKTFIIDVDKCMFCIGCQLGCKDEHVGNDWTPYAKPQPVTGQFWTKVNRVVRGTIPKVKLAYYPVMCMHCDDAPCIEACPNGSISKRADGLVVIDPKKCQGHQLCIEACPYEDIIFFNTDLGIAQKCTGCSHLLDRGWPIKEPRCTDNCSTSAIVFGDESDFSAEIAQSEALPPTKAGAIMPNVRVHYLNLPKKFIGGLVYDPATEEVIIGATCTLTGGGETYTTETDAFGDFWFEDLPVDTFSLVIESNGKTYTQDNISTENDVNLGDLVLS
jgi:Fe-S-cluster-containing dehydrogenase component